MNWKKLLLWACQLVPAIILLQTLRFKLTADPLSIHIFETVGMEPVGRIGSAIWEGLAGVFLFIPRMAGIGAVMGMLMTAGAIVSHLTVLGINVQGDGGTLFGMAILVFVLCTIVAIIRRKELPVIGSYF